MNQCNFIGRLTRDPELRHTQSGVAVTSFSIAVDRPYSKDKEKEVDFIDVVCFRGTAEFTAKYFHKGQQIALSGRLQMRQWQDKDGHKRINAEVVADNVYFCGEKKETAAQFQEPEYTPAAQTEFAELGNDGDLPFDSGL
jgi:single-strand DNA-binding protein